MDLRLENNDGSLWRTQPLFVPDADKIHTGALYGSENGCEIYSSDSDGLCSVAYAQFLTPGGTEV